MTQSSRFFGSAAGDQRQYNQVEFAEVMERFFKTGIFPEMFDELNVTETVPPKMAINIASGMAWINGYYYKNDSDLEIDLVPADANEPRIDLVILRLDTVGDRLIVGAVKTGTPSASPISPSLTQNTQVWEIPLAKVIVAAGATSIVDASITTEDAGEAVPRNSASKRELEDHIDDKNDPHDVTKAQVGLGNVPNIDFRNYGLGTNAIQVSDLNSITASGFYKVDSGGSNIPSAGPWEVVHFNYDGNSSSQIAQNAGGTGSSPVRQFIRNKGTGVWTSWVEILTKSNLGNVDNVKQLPIAGGTMTGDFISKQNISGVITDSLQKPVMIRSNSTMPSLMTFIREANFAAHFGIDVDNKWKVGGWSMGANSYEIFHRGNTQFSDGGTGYMVLPNGFCLQWGLTSVDSWGETIVTYPIAFNFAFSVVLTPRGAYAELSVGFINSNQFSVQNDTQAFRNLSWIAVGTMN